jgi:type IV secretion system protein VirB10
VVTIAALVCILYVLATLESDPAARRRTQVTPNIYAANDELGSGGTAFQDAAEEPAEAIPLPEAEVPDAPSLILLPDGTIGEPPKIELAETEKANESAKRNIRIVQKPPSERWQNARNLMLNAMHSDTKIPFQEPPKDESGTDGNTSGNYQNDGNYDINGILSGVGDYLSGNRGNAESSFEPGDGNSTAMAHQDRNNSFAASNAGNSDTAKEYVGSTRRGAIGKYELKAGTVISGVLMGRINSDLPGTVLGQVSENIYDTATGANLLIPQGSRMVGVYDSHIVYGQHRVLVVWQRIVYPDGTSLNLEGMLGADQSGQSGFKQRIDNHYTRLIGAALFASVFVAAGKVATEDDRNADGTESTVAESVMEQMAALGARMAERNLNVAPTLTILPGYRFSIITLKDIAFAETYYMP